MRKLFSALVVFCCMLFSVSMCFAALDDQKGPGEHGIQVTERPAIYYEAYLHDKGWSQRCGEMTAAGDPYGANSLDALRVYVDLNPYLDILYHVHVAGGEWSSWVANGQTAGAPGVPIDAVEISLGGRAAMFFSVSYKVLVEGKGWQDWVPMGDTAGDFSGKIKSIRIKLD